MTNSFLVVLTLVSALGCGLIAGVFFAFSSFVMKSLARLPAPQGIAAMQSINIVAITPWFMTALFGTAAACVIILVSALMSLHRPGSGYLVTGALLYLCGTVLVTIVFNVPRNNALAAIDPASSGAALFWARYVDGWSAWNHVRTSASLVAAASLTIALGRSVCK